MRYNTKNKKIKVKNWVINWLTDYGYGKDTAEYEVNNWIELGLNSLSPTVREDIRIALVNHTYSLKTLRQN